MPAVFALVFGIAAGWASGGSLKALAQSSIRWGWLVITLFVVQGFARGRLVGLGGGSSGGVAIWVSCSIALAVALLLQWRAPGMAVAATGILINSVVVLLNGRMPVGPLPAPGFPVTEGLTTTQRLFYQATGQHTLGAALGDVVPLKVLGNWTLLSVGDILLMVGVFAWVVAAMTVDSRKSLVLAD